MQVYIGIDWSEKKHDVVLMNDEGAITTQMVIEHTQVGFSKLSKACEQVGVKPNEVIVGLETAHNLLIDYLWNQGYNQVYVVPPSVVKSNQGRYGSSGSVNDPKAARLIADILRTDRGRLYPWHPDSLLTRQMRAKVSLILHLTKQVTRISNRLRAILLRYYPVALEIFKDGLGTQIALYWIQNYPNPPVASQLDLETFKAFTQQYHYPQRWVTGAYARLKADYPQSSLETQTIFEDEAVLLAKILLEYRQNEIQQRKELHKLFVQHPNYSIFSSLPAGSEFLGAALCAKFGDDRQRFPRANDVQVLAGTVRDESQWEGPLGAISHRIRSGMA